MMAHMALIHDAAAVWAFDGAIAVVVVAVDAMVLLLISQDEHSNDDQQSLWHL